MKKITLKIVLTLIIAGLMTQNFSCSQKKTDWTTDSAVALENFELGRNFNNSFNKEKAIVYFNKAFQADTNFALAALSLAQVYYQSGRMDSSKYFLKKARHLAKSASRYEQLLINRVYNSFTMNSIAVKNIEDTLMVEYPDRFEVQVIRAGQAFQRGEYGLSRKIYMKILEDNPDYAMAYNMIAYSYTMEGYYRDAYDYFRKYLEVASNTLNPYDSMAEFYMMTGRYQEAIDILEKLIAEKNAELKENRFLSAVINLKIADGYRHLGQYTKAIEYAEAAKYMHRPVPNYHQINHFRFYLYRDLGSLQKMREEYNFFKNQVASFQSTFFGILLDIAAQNYSAAEKRIDDFCSKSQQKDKYYIRFLSILEGELAFARERYALAAEKFKTAYAIHVDMYPEKIENKYYIATGLDGNYDAAIQGFLKILNKNPNNPTALYYISHFYYEKGDQQKAANYLNHFFTLWAEADEYAPLLIKAKNLRRMLNQVGNQNNF